RKGTHVSNCNRDTTKLLLRKFDEKLNERATSTQETTDTILCQRLTSIPDTVRARLPALDHVKRKIRKRRQNHHLPSVPNNIDFPSVPPVLQVPNKRFFFLRSDSGPGPDRLLIFSSPEQLSVLETATDFLVDGTFEVVPEIFYQLYVIHAVYRGHVIPVVFALLRRKNAVTYQRLINHIIEFAPLWYPESILLDYEKAAKNVFETGFPHVTLSGCYFHLRQSVHRQLQTRGFQHRYENDLDFAHGIHKIVALCFIHPDNVIDGFSRLSIELDPSFQEILDYFEDTYIG
ncbi:unnamed protein product, partial [Didymodactylos carnosus]